MRMCQSYSVIEGSKIPEKQEEKETKKDKQITAPHRQG